MENMNIPENGTEQSRAIWNKNKLVPSHMLQQKSIPGRLKFDNGKKKYIAFIRYYRSTYSRSHISQ